MRKTKTEQYELYERQWNAAELVADVAKIWGLTRNQASYRASDLRDKGYPLKRFSTNPTSRKGIKLGPRKRQTPYEPSLEEIASKCLAIRQGWANGVQRERVG